MHTYRQYCPVAKAHEILGDRWTMLVVRELISGQESFNDIARGLPGIPRSTLSNRLRRLEASGVLQRTPAGKGSHRYCLTAAGKDLGPVVHAMGRWGAAWAFEMLNEADLDPGLLLWRMQNRLNVAALPGERVTVAFDFQRGPKGCFWFVINDGGASVCITDPGFDIGLSVTADLAAFYQVWLGRMAWRDAVARGLIRVEGMPALERAFPDWFLWSPMAPYSSPGPLGDSCAPADGQDAGRSRRTAP
jgi:DNA-binding HxlR family transcriptional regulator